MTGLKVNLDVTLSSELSVSVFDSDLVGRSHAIVYCPE